MSNNTKEVNVQVAPLTENEREELERLRAEKACKANKALYSKVSEKGCICTYGLTSRFPISLYIGQLIRFVAWIRSGSFIQFIQQNQAQITGKDGENVAEMVQALVKLLK